MRARVQVVVAGAVADAVAGAVERRQRHQHDVGNRRSGSGRRRLEDAERPAASAGRSGDHARNASDLPRAVHHRQRQPRALLGELAHQRHRIDLAADRRIAWRRPCPAGDLERQPALGQAWRRCGALLVSAHRAWRAAGAEFGFRGAACSSFPPTRRTAFCRHQPARRSDPVFQRLKLANRDAAAYWIPRLRRGMTAVRAAPQEQSQDKNSARPQMPLKHSIPEFPYEAGGHLCPGPRARPGTVP